MTMPLSRVIPLWYHPTTVLFVDDDSDFLDLMKGHVSPIFSCWTETSPERAEIYLKKHVYDLSALAGSVSQQNFDTSSVDDQVDVYDVRLSALRSHLNVADRFQKSVVVVIDRHMPDMDGLDLCRKIRYTYRMPVKLILLTSATTADEALTAFNAGIIDSYIKKNTGDVQVVLDQINQAIKTLAEAQFNDLGRELLGGLTPRFTHLMDPIFCNIFEKIRNEKNIVEFYILNASGSLFLLDKKGNAKVLLICKDADFRMMQDIAEDSEAPKAVLEALENREQYPLVLSDGSTLLEGAEWLAAMVPVQRIPDRGFFYGLVDYPEFNSFGFEQYLTEKRKKVD